MASLHPVDVAGVLERAGADAHAAPGTQGWALAQVAAAIAALIEADHELDRAQSNYTRAVFDAVLYGDAAEMEMQANWRLVDAREVRERALSALCGGAA